MHGNAKEHTGTSTIYNSSYTWSSLTTDEQKYNEIVGQLSSTTGNKKVE